MLGIQSRKRTRGRVHNMYVRNLVTSYVSRFSELCNGVVAALERGDFLVYALCGRALIETTAILRYYVMRKYKPLLDKKILSGDGMKTLIEIDDRHLRGTGFDWGGIHVPPLFEAQRRRGHKRSGRRAELGAMPGQIPIGRCIDSWSKETSSVGVAYDPVLRHGPPEPRQLVLDRFDRHRRAVFHQSDGGACGNSDR